MIQDNSEHVRPCQSVPFFYTPNELFEKSSGICEVRSDVSDVVDVGIEPLQKLRRNVSYSQNFIFTPFLQDWFFRDSSAENVDEFSFICF